MAIMKKLAGTNWGGGEKVLRKLNTGRVRPALECSMAAWTTAAKTHFDRISRIQNQALQIIT